MEKMADATFADNIWRSWDLKCSFKVLCAVKYVLESEKSYLLSKYNLGRRGKMKRTSVTKWIYLK